MSEIAALEAEPTWFDRTTAIRPGGPGRWEVDLDPSWASLTGIHGGSMVAMVVRAVEAHEPRRPVRTVATSFLRPGRPGPARIRVEPVRRGRSLTTVTATLEQDRAVLVSRLTLVEPRDGTAWHAAAPAEVPPPAACIPLAPPPEAGRVAHFDHATAVLDPAHVPFSRSDVARVGGHVRPLEPRPIDAPWLAMIVDWFPPSPFTRTDRPDGGVSIDLTVHVHRTRPAPPDGDWLAAWFVADVSAGGLALERGRVADADGTLLAESFHTRWTG